MKEMNRFKLPQFVKVLAAIAWLGTLPSFAADLPGPLKLFPVEAGMERLDMELYPLGWTASGEGFAYLVVRPQEAADERFWSLKLVDLVTDELIVDQELIQETAGGIGDFWRIHGRTIEGLLSEHGVNRLGEIELRHFPALEGRFRSESYEVTVSRKYGEEPNFEYRGLKEFVVRVINGTGNTKTVFDQSWAEWYPLAGGVIGYLPNPQGDRLAIILAFTQRGYEGPPHTRLLEITGVRIGEKF